VLKIKNLRLFCRREILRPEGDDKAENMLTDQELLHQFRKIEKMPDDRKRLLKEVIDAFLLKSDLQQKLAS